MNRNLEICVACWRPKVHCNCETHAGESSPASPCYPGALVDWFNAIIRETEISDDEDGLLFFEKDQRVQCMAANGVHLCDGVTRKMWEAFERVILKG